MQIIKPAFLQTASVLLLGACLLFAGCGKPPPDPTQRRADEITLIRQVLTDPERADRLLGLIEQRDLQAEETRAMRAKFRREMRLLNADFDARREVLVEIIDVFNRERAAELLRYIELVTAMKATSTATEWQAIANFQRNYSDSGQAQILDLFLLGGGLMGGTMLEATAVERLEARFPETISDPERSTEAAQVVRDLDREVEDYNRTFVTSATRVREIYRDHGAGSRRLLRELEELNLAWYASQSRNMVLRDRLREAMTADEWSRVFPVTE